MKLSVVREDKYAIIKLADRIEWENARELDCLVKNLLDEKVYHIAFDLNDVSFICSGGIGALVYNLNSARKNGGAIYILSSNEYIDFMFETLKFDMVFEGYLYPSIEDFRDRVITKQQSA